MSKHAQPFALFDYLDYSARWVGRDERGRFARVVGTHAQRREALELPRPAHALPLTLDEELRRDYAEAWGQRKLEARDAAGEPPTYRGLAVADLAAFIPYVASSMDAAAELKLAVDRVRAMFDDMRAEALLEQATALAPTLPDSLADTIHRLADEAARADYAERVGPPVMPAPPRERWLEAWRGRHGHVYAPCIVEPIGLDDKSYDDMVARLDAQVRERVDHMFDDDRRYRDEYLNEWPA